MIAMTRSSIFVRVTARRMIVTEMISRLINNERLLIDFHIAQSQEILIIDGIEVIFLVKFYKEEKKSYKRFVGI